MIKKAVARIGDCFLIERQWYIIASVPTDNLYSEDIQGVLLVCLKDDFYISYGGNISSGGDISSSRGSISLNFHLRLRGKLSCRAIRVATNEDMERKYWSEKFGLFGFKKGARIVLDTNLCVSGIIKAFLGTKGYKKRLLSCKYFTKFEKAVLKSWLCGGLKEYKLCSK